ncbi:hypothetical protein ACFL2T_07375 [Elusimicrobiota bacterium]
MSYRTMPSAALIVGLALLAGGCPAKMPKDHRENQAWNTRLPFLEATASQKAAEKKGLTVAAETLPKSDQKLYFSRNLRGKGFVPVLLTVTNGSDERLLIQSADALLILPDDLEAKNTGLDPIYKKIGFSPNRFVGLNEGRLGQRYVNWKYDRAETLRNILGDRALGSFVLEPRKTRRGFVFFAKKDVKAASRGGEPKLRLPVEILDKIGYFDVEVPIERKR